MVDATSAAASAVETDLVGAPAADVPIVGASLSGEVIELLAADAVCCVTPVVVAVPVVCVADSAGCADTVAMEFASVDAWVSG